MAGETISTGPGYADRWLEAWMRWVAARPRRVLGGLALLLALAVLAATRLDVDPDSSKMLSPELPSQARALAVNEAFPSIKNAIAVVVRGDTADSADLVVGALVARLRDGPAWIEDVFATAQDPFFAANGFLYRDVDAVSEIFTRITKSANLVAQLRVEQTPAGLAQALNQAAELSEQAEISVDALDRLYSEAAHVFEASQAGAARPFGWSSVLDDAADPGPAVRVISVTPRLDLGRLSPAKPALAEITAAIDALPPDLLHGVAIGITGEPALRTEELDSVLGTIGISMTLSLVMVALILRVGLGETGRAALAFGSLLCALVLSTGFAGLAIGNLNLVSIAFVVLMVGLGIDFAIHILAHVVEMRRHGTAPGEAVALTGRRTGLALVLSAITTSLAFLAFATTDFDGMAQLGLIGGVGVLIAFAVAATLIPAAVALWPGLTGGTAQRPDAGAGFRGGNILPIAVMLAGALAVIPALQARFDADPMGLRDPAASSVLAFNLLADDPQTTPYRASILAPSLGAAEAAAERFANTPGVGAAITLADLVPEAQDEKLMLLDFAAPSIEHAVAGSPTDLSAGPESATPLRDLADRLRDADGPGGRLAAAIDAYLADETPDRRTLLQQNLFQTFPLMLDRLGAMLEADYVTRDSLPPSLSARFVSDQGLYRVEILPEDNLTDPAAVAAFANTVTQIDAQAAGGPIQLAAAGDSVGAAMLQATAMAGLMTLILAYWATRRVVDTAAILIPLVVAGVLTAAASVLLDMPFNYANVIVLPLLIGIGVDSGIHIALRERRAPGAVYATSTPRAVLFSALTTMAAFGTLALSDHRGTASMGVLLAVAMTAAVGCVLALTPALIRWARADQVQTVR